ncbi:MAG: flagellar hook-length control protein FliK [Hyphomicrobium sp.]
MSAKSASATGGSERAVTGLEEQWDEELAASDGNGDEIDATADADLQAEPQRATTAEKADAAPLALWAFQSKLSSFGTDVPTDLDGAIGVVEGDAEEPSGSAAETAEPLDNPDQPAVMSEALATRDLMAYLQAPVTPSSESDAATNAESSESAAKTSVPIETLNSERAKTAALSSDASAGAIAPKIGRVLSSLAQLMTRQTMGLDTAVQAQPSIASDDEQKAGDGQASTTSATSDGDVANASAPTLRPDASARPAASVNDASAAGVDQVPNSVAARSSAAPEAVDQGVSGDGEHGDAEIARLGDEMKISVVRQEAHIAPMTRQSPVQQLAAATASAAHAAVAVKDASAPAPEAPIVKVLELRLEPDNLGTITVRMSITNGHMRLVLGVEAQDVARQVERDREELGKFLQASGFILDAVDVHAMRVEGTSSPQGAEERRLPSSGQQAFTGNGGASAEAGGQGQRSDSQRTFRDGRETGDGDRGSSVSQTRSTPPAGRGLYI